MLFGHQNDVNQAGAPSTAPSMAASQDTSATGLNPLAVDPATGVSLPTSTTDAVASVDPTQEEPSILNQSSTLDYTASSSVFAGDPAPTTPFGSDQANTPTMSDAPQTEAAAPNEVPTVSTPQPDPIPAPQPTTMAELRLSSTPTESPVASNADDLLSIKQQALSQLGPLVGQLEQDPEEKFRTTMMLIQSTDNPALLKDAYDAAQAISDEKVRAQALLDIVNEINYFTQQSSAQPQAQSAV